MKTALLVVAMITCTVVANLLLKTGAMEGRGEAVWWMQVANWKIAAGLASFGTAALLYIIVLRILPLNVALSYTAAQWIATVAASAYVLSEPIGGLRLAGLALIAAGIAIVASTA
jgi:undecaprenyl phosphate-alpha-L-ara4N flippase subunit ArnE